MTTLKQKPNGIYYLDPHSQRALDLFGEVTSDTRSRAKLINYAEAYGSGQINLSRIGGQYPLERSKP